MNILQVIAMYYPYIGGVQEHVKNISENLSKNNNVTICTTDPTGILPKVETINGLKVIRFKSWAPNDCYFFSSQLKNFLLRHSDDYDIVHAHCYHDLPALYAAQAKRRNKFIFTSHYHGTGHTFFRSLLHRPYKLMGKKIFEKSDKIVCVSNYEKKLIIENFSISEEKIVIIPNGVNLREFQNITKKKSNDHKMILYVGRLENYKGIDYLIRALPRMDEKIHFEVIGKGPEKNHLIELSKSLGVAGRVVFYEDLPRNVVLQKYADANLVVSLSTREAYALTIAEALTTETRCLVANSQALSEWIDNDNCVGINYPIDIKELSNLIENLVDNHKSIRFKLNRIMDWSEVVSVLEKEVYKNS